MKFIIVFILFFSTNTYSVCIDNIGGCDFYQCIENEYSCGAQGYPLNFGEKYCRQLNRNEHQLSTQGKQWLSKASICLQKKLASAQTFQNCTELRQQAFNNHVECYVDHGFCKLPNQDKLIVLKSIQEVIFNQDVLSTMLKIAQRCTSRFEKF